MFFFKKNKLVVDCFTANKSAYELFKLEHAKKFYPEWWKKIPNAVPNPKQPSDLTAPTMKGCAGIIDYYQTGMIIPLWTDAIIEIGKIGSNFLRVALAHPQADSEQHAQEQRGDYLPDSNYSHVKFSSPWHIEVNKPTSFIMIKPIWNFHKPEEFILPPGRLNFYYQHSSNVNVFFKREKENYTLNLDSGTPMAHLIPQTDEHLDIRCHLISHIEYARKTDAPFRFSWTNGYKKYVSLKKKRD